MVSRRKNYIKNGSSCALDSKERPQPRVAVATGPTLGRSGIERLNLRSKFECREKEIK